MQYNTDQERNPRPSRIIAADVQFKDDVSDLISVEKKKGGGKGQHKYVRILLIHIHINVGV